MIKAYLRYTIFFFTVALIAGCSKKDVYTFNTSSGSHKKVVKQNVKQGDLQQFDVQSVVSNNDDEALVAHDKKATINQKRQIKAIKKVEQEAIIDQVTEVIPLNRMEKKVLKRVTRKASNGGDNQVVALVLCWFFGIIGVHRFYLGYTAIGVLQLLTLGLCGIWTLIDLIRIATGDLKPMDGEYAETLNDAF